MTVFHSTKCGLYSKKCAVRALLFFLEHFLSTFPLLDLAVYLVYQGKKHVGSCTALPDPSRSSQRSSSIYVLQDLWEASNSLLSDVRNVPAGNSIGGLVVWCGGGGGGSRLAACQEQGFEKRKYCHYSWRPSAA
ncbi:hypothetical protein HOY80DRAFT_1005225 [Tuber brumale]|nr:hypothetical protein HOY80DRAFT_1005225 [Tuber brumale]